jgi:GTP-binding protein
MSLPTIVLVGRPNVGKSTLFNRLCETRSALMSDIPGTTRDWQEGRAHWNGRIFRVIDTGGYSPGNEAIIGAVRLQVERWAKEADITLWVVDGLEGLTPADQSLASWMRAKAKNVVVVVNKVDDAKRDAYQGEFHRFGFPAVIPVSATHGRNVHELLEKMEELAPSVPEEPEDPNIPKVALLGRPNVGKSSLLNAVLGETRMIVSDVPGTTRDAVDTLVERGGKKFLFIDTAGMRTKKSKSSEGLEGLMRIMAEKALERADVAVLMFDASEGILEGDIAVGRLIESQRRACVVGVNKWDIVKDRFRTGAYYRDNYGEDLPFLTHAPLVFLSAKTGHHVEELLKAVSDAHAAYRTQFDDDTLTDFFWREVQERPYSHHGRKLIFYVAEQVASAPPVIVLRSNYSDEDVHFSFRRHLENVFRKRFNLQGSPLVLKFKKGKR